MELGYGVLISDSGSSLEGEKKALSSFFRNRVDAVLWEAPACTCQLPFWSAFVCRADGGDR